MKTNHLEKRWLEIVKEVDNPQWSWMERQIARRFFYSGAAAFHSCVADPELSDTVYLELEAELLREFAED